MTDQRTIERQTTALLSEVAPTHAPDRLYADVLTSIGRTRQRTRWLAYFKESPMRTPSGVAVGSPTFRLASILAIALGLILALGAAVAVGASLLPTPAIVVAQDGSGTVRTITEAVAMAADGDTILVKPGTYLGSIAITEDITLRGDGDRKAVVLEFAADGPRARMGLRLRDPARRQQRARGESHRARSRAGRGDPDRRRSAGDRRGRHRA